MTPPRVLVVDDKPSNLRLFAEALAADNTVSTARNGRVALDHLAQHPIDVLVTDIRMPEMDGFTLLDQVKKAHPEVEVILLTAFGSVPKAVEAMKAGAYNYLTKPVDPDELSLVVGQAAERRRLRDVAARHATPARRFGRLVGESPAMQQLFHLMERAAASEATVLVAGESGTGKELVARGIHEHGARADGPFVPINCGAIPEALLESELFGHDKGAFTGADVDKRGLFDEAEGGTLFLDEVGELPLQLQVKLNRVLQERTYRRVGGGTERPFDVRVISATNVDLHKAVDEGRFREDLYFRLNVFPIRTPPLRERADDIPRLARALLARHGDPDIEGFTPEALEAMAQRPWRGNVRELENAIVRALAVCAGARIEARDLPEGPAEAPAPQRSVSTELPFKEAVDQARDRASQDYLTNLMRTFEGNVTQAAQHAGMERESLHRLLKRHGVRPADFR